MKIAILTQPLHTNYGGLLQAYALQQTLRDMGHDAETLDIPWSDTNIKYKIYFSIISWTKFCIYGIMGKKAKDIIYNPFFTYYDKLNCTTKNTKTFVEKYILTSPKIKSETQLYKYCKKKGFDAYIVGSDQVWRPMYSRNIYWFYLSFLGNENNVKKIAYSASFGVDKWEYTEEQTKLCKDFVSSFNSVSVREKSGIELCNKYLKADATLVLDPTLLRNKEEYIKIAKHGHQETFGHCIMTYILDRNINKSNILQKVSEKLHLNPIEVRSEMELGGKTSRIDLDKCTPPAVERWIQGFIDADFVVTDSFHGTVFSIIFNKPFIVIPNDNRGNSRIESLLCMFHLEERIVRSKDEITDETLKSTIDWDCVNSILQNQKEKSLIFLTDSLEK